MVVSDVHAFIFDIIIALFWVDIWDGMSKQTLFVGSVDYSLIHTMLIDEYSQRILVSDVQRNLSRFEVSVLVTPNTYLKGIQAKGEA